MMTFSMMMFPMMVALDVFLVLEFVRQEIFYRLIRLAAAATVKGDSGLFQPFLGSSADATADHPIDTQLLEHTGQSPVPLSLGAVHFCLLYLPVCQIIDFEILRPAKMLEDFSVFRIVGHCKFHRFLLPLGDAAYPFQGPQGKPAAAQLCIVGNFHLAPIQGDIPAMD